MASPPPLSPTPRRWRPAGQPSAVVETLNQLAHSSDPTSPEQEFLSPLSTPAVVDGAAELAANVTGDSLNKRYDSLYAGLEAFGASFNSAPAGPQDRLSPPPPPPLAPSPPAPLPNPPELESRPESPPPAPHAEPPASSSVSTAITAPSTPLPPSPVKAPRPRKQWTPKPATATPTKNTRASELIRMFESKNDSPASTGGERRLPGAVATPFREAATKVPAAAAARPLATSSTLTTRTRSPISSVQKMVASWRARNAQATLSESSSSTTPSTLFRKQSWNVSIRRQRRNEAEEKVAEHVPDEARELRPDTPPHPSPVAEASDDASFLPPSTPSLRSAPRIRTGEPLRTGNLFYFNVHDDVEWEDYTWVATDARLYADGLELVWRTASGALVTVALDLEYCEEVASTYSPSNPGADDLGAVAARKRGDEFARGLYPFKMVYDDGTERLGCESAIERVRWVKAMWEALENSRTGRPTPSVLTGISRSSSHSGSRSTRLHTTQGAREVTDDAVVSTAGGLAAPLASRGSRRLVASPLARARSLRKVASASDLTDSSSNTDDQGPLPPQPRIPSGSSRWKSPQSFGTAAELLGPGASFGEAAAAMTSDVLSPPQAPFRTPSTAAQSFYSPAPASGTRSLLSPASFHTGMATSPASVPLSFQTPAASATSYTLAATSPVPTVTSPLSPSEPHDVLVPIAEANTPPLTIPSQVTPRASENISAPSTTTATEPSSRPASPRTTSLASGTPRSGVSKFTLRSALQNVAPPPSESEGKAQAAVSTPPTAAVTTDIPPNKPLSSPPSTATRSEVHAPSELTRYQLYDPPVPPSTFTPTTGSSSTNSSESEGGGKADAPQNAVPSSTGAPNSASAGVEVAHNLAAASTRASSSIGAPAESVSPTDITHDLVAAVDAAIDDYTREAAWESGGATTEHRSSTPQATKAASVADPATPTPSSRQLGSGTPRSGSTQPSVPPAATPSAYYSLSGPSTHHGTPSRASSSDDKENFNTPSVLSSPFAYAGHMPPSARTSAHPSPRRVPAASLGSDPVFTSNFVTPSEGTPLQAVDNNYEPRQPATYASRSTQRPPLSSSGQYTAPPSVSSYESAPPVPIPKSASAYTTPSVCASPSTYSSAPPPPVSKSSWSGGRRDRLSTLPPSNRSGTPVSEPDLDSGVVFGLERHSSAGSAYSPDPPSVPPQQAESRYTTAHEYSLYGSAESRAFTTATAGATRYHSASDAPSFGTPPYPLSTATPTTTPQYTSSYLETIPETLGPVPHSSSSTFDDTTRARGIASPYQSSKSSSSFSSPQSLGPVPLSLRPSPISTRVPTVPESIGTVPPSLRPPTISAYVTTVPESIGTVPSPRKAWTPSPLSMSTVVPTLPESFGPVPSSRNSWVTPTPKATPAPSVHSRLSAVSSSAESTRPESLGPVPPSLRVPPQSISTPQSTYGTSRSHRKPVPTLEPTPPVAPVPLPRPPPSPHPSSSDSSLSRSSSSSSSTATAVDYPTLRLLNYLQSQGKVQQLHNVRIANQLDRIENKIDRNHRPMKHLEKLDLLDNLRKLEKLDLLDRLGELGKLDRLDDLPPPLPSKDSIFAESPPPSPTTSVSTLSETERPVTPPAFILPESFNQRMEEMGQLLSLVMGQQKDIVEELAHRRELDAQGPSRVEGMLAEILRQVEGIAYQPKPFASLPRKRPASSESWSEIEGDFYTGSQSVNSGEFGQHAPAPPNTLHSTTSLLSRIPESLLEDETLEPEFDDEYEIDNLPPASPPHDQQQYRAPVPDAVARQRYEETEYEGEVDDEVAAEEVEPALADPAPVATPPPVPYRRRQASDRPEEEIAYHDEQPQRRRPTTRAPPPEPIELPTPVNSEYRKLRDAPPPPGPAGPPRPRPSMSRFGRPRSPLSTTYVHPRFRPAPLGPYPPPGMMPMMPPPGMAAYVRPGFFPPPGYGAFGPGMYRPPLATDTGIGTTTTASSTHSPLPPPSAGVSANGSHLHTPTPSATSQSASAADPAIVTPPVHSPVPPVTIKITPASIEEIRSASDGVPSMAGSPSVTTTSVPLPSVSPRSAFSHPISTTSTHRMLGNTQALGEAMGEQQNDMARYMHGISDQVHDVNIGLTRDLGGILAKLDTLRKDLRPERVHGHVLPDGTVQLSTGEIVDGIQGAPPPVPVAVVPPPPDSPAVLVGRVLPDGTVMAGEKIVVGIQGVPRDPTPEELAEEAQRAKDRQQDQAIDDLAAMVSDMMHRSTASSHHGSHHSHHSHSHRGTPPPVTNTKEVKETKETKEVTNNTTTIIKEHDKDHERTVHEHVHSPRTELLSPHLPPIPTLPPRGQLIREEVEEYIHRPDGKPATHTITRTQTYTDGSIPPVPRLSDPAPSHHSHAGTHRPQDESEHGGSHHGTHHGGTQHPGTRPPSHAGTHRPSQKVWTTNPVHESRMGSVVSGVSHRDPGRRPDAENNSIDKVLGWRPSVSGDPARVPLPPSEFDPDGPHFPGDGHSAARPVLHAGRPAPSVASNAGSTKKDLPDMPLLTTRTKIVPSVADPAETVKDDSGNPEEQSKDDVREGPPIVQEVPNAHKVKGSDKNTRFSHTLHPFHRSHGKGESDKESDQRPLRVLGDSATEPEPEEATTTEPKQGVEGEAGKKPDSAAKATEPSLGKEPTAHSDSKSPTPPTATQPLSHGLASTHVGRTAEPRQETEMEEVPIYQPITLPDGSKALIPMGKAKVPSARPTPVASGVSTPVPETSKGKPPSTTQPAAGKETTPEKSASGSDKEKQPSGPASAHVMHNVPAEEKSDKPDSSPEHAKAAETAAQNLPKDHDSSSKSSAGSSKPSTTDGSKVDTVTPEDSAAKLSAGDKADDTSKPPPVPKPPKSLPILPIEASTTRPAPPEREKESWEITSPAATMPPPVSITPTPNVNKIKRKPVAKDGTQSQTLADKPADNAWPAAKTTEAGSAVEKESVAQDKLHPPGSSGPAGDKPPTDKPSSDKPAPHKEPPPPPGSNSPPANPPGHVPCHCVRCCTDPPRLGYHDEATSTAAPEPAKQSASKDPSAKDPASKEPASKEPASKPPSSKDSAAKDGPANDAATKDDTAKNPPSPKLPATPAHIPLSHQTAPVHPDHPTFSPVPFPDVTGPYANVPLPKPTPPPSEAPSKAKQPGKEANKVKDPKGSDQDGEAEASAAKDKAVKEPEPKEPAAPKSPKTGSKKGKEADGDNEANKDKAGDKQKGATEQGPTETADKEQRQKERDEDRQLAADRHKEVIERITNIEKTLETLMSDNKEWRAEDKEWRTENAELDKKLVEMLEKLVGNGEEIQKALEAESKKPGVQAVLDAFKTANEGQAAFLRKMGTEIMEQNSNQHKLTQDASKLWAREQVTFNMAGYFNDFTKMLAGEVRVLCHEVHGLAERRRALYLEMSDLLLQKARMSGNEVLGIIPYPMAPGKGPPGPPKKDEKKDGKPKEDGKGKPQGPPAWTAYLPPVAPMMGMPPMGPGRPLPPTPTMMAMGPPPMPFMPDADPFGMSYGNPYPMQMPVPFPTGARPLPQPKPVQPKEGGKPAAEGE